MAAQRPPITRALAAWCASVEWDARPASERARVLDSLVDTVGVAVAGVGDPDMVPVRAFLAATGAGSEGPSQLWGEGRSVRAAAAALFNGTSGHVMDFDDVHYVVHGHPSTVLFPALIAVAQERGIGAVRMLEGYVAGLGVMSAVATAYGPRHYTAGWHSTSTTGAVGAAAGVATMLGLDEQAIARAMSAAVSMSMGSRANFGTHLKPLHAGFAARAGVEAVQLVEAGALPVLNALEAPLGGVDIFGDGSWPGAHADPLGVVLAAAEHGSVQLGLKMYPCCRGAHFAVDAALEVREQLGIVDEFAAVQVDVPLGAKVALLYDDPSTGLEGKFSLPYAVATSLVRGLPTPEHFTDAAVADARVREVMSIISVAEDPSGGDLSAGMEGRYAMVTVRSADGRTASARVDDARGSWSRPLSAAEVDEKFLACTVPVWGDEAARRTLAALRQPSERSLQDVLPDARTADVVS